MRATLIVNPYASAVSEELVREVERELGAAYELETVLTERRGHAVELAREAGTETIFAFGGDGVSNEVLNGVVGDRRLGFVPGGGTNVLPRALGLPRDAVAAAHALVAARERRISLGRVNGRRFAFGAGIGLTRLRSGASTPWGELPTVAAPATRRSPARSSASSHRRDGGSRTSSR